MPSLCLNWTRPHGAVPPAIFNRYHRLRTASGISGPRSGTSALVCFCKIVAVLSHDPFSSMNLCTYLSLPLSIAFTGSGASQKRASKKPKLSHINRPSYEEEIEEEEILPAKTTTRSRNRSTAKGKQNVKTTTSVPQKSMKKSH